MKMNSERKQVIDTSNLSWCDMAVLKKQDPFMYYSIPGNRDAKLPGEEIDLSELELAPDSNDAELSRSFTCGTVKTGHWVEDTKPRRHSEQDAASETKESAKRRGSGATFEFALQCPSFTIQEEERIFTQGTGEGGHSRCKSYNNAVALSLPNPTSHRRASTESAVTDDSKLVYRKSAISFESYVDDMLDDIIDEVAELQPRRPSVQIDVTRRGSVLQDILFNSIGTAMGELGELDFSDSDSD
jgi:hypothetical protein